MDNFDLKKFLTENKLTRTSVLREGVEDDIEQAIKDKKIDPKKVKDAAEKAEKGNDSKDLAVLMATANMMKEAKKKKKKDAPEDEEIDLDLDTETPEGNEDVNFSMDDTSSPSPDDSVISTINDTLLKALDAAEQLGDEKLTKQIGNTITMFTRTHISQPDQPINEDEEYVEGSNNRYFTGDDDGPSLNISEVEDYLEGYIFDDWDSVQDSPSIAKKLSDQNKEIQKAINKYLESGLSQLTKEMTDKEIEDQMDEDLDLNSYLEY
jgi:hypothetical protein